MGIRRPHPAVPYCQLLVVDRQMAPLVFAKAVGAPCLTHVLDVGGAPLGSCPRWLIRYLVGAVCPSRENTGTCQGGMLFVPPVGVP
eukprot:5517475-Pyramimonas_sp.AAC.1